MIKHDFLRYPNRSTRNIAATLGVTLIVVALCFCLSNPVFGEAKKQDVKSTATDPALRLKGFETHMEMGKNSIFKNLPWMFVGPNNLSGRMTDIAVVGPKGKNYTIYAAGASGGVWKTVNEGTTWEPIFQNAPSTSIGDVTIAPSNPDIIWVGTGEANIYRSSQAGIGVYKSVDAGKTWQHMGLIDTYTIPRILIHPANPDIVYVASSGHEWTTNPERGIYKTTNGGQTWEKILFVNDMTGVIDMVMDPTDPDTIYASTWQRIRKKYHDPRNEPIYSGSGIHKTTDGGKTWTAINRGLPMPQFRGRIGIDICKSKPNVLYALVDNYEISKKEADSSKIIEGYVLPGTAVIRGATIFRSDDKGENWKQVSENNEFMESVSGTYGWVFGNIRVDPNNDKKIFVLGVALCVSEDSGKTFRQIWDIHADHHGMWIDPDNSNYVCDVNDGGFAISYDGGKTWKDFLKDFPLVQFFNIAVDNANPFHLLGSIQDHGSCRGTIDLSRGRNFIPAVAWEDTPGGEASSHAVDPTDTNIVYSEAFYGTITRTDLRTKESVSIVPKPPKGEPMYRGQWLAPFILSPHNPQTIYHGMNYLFRSTNRGDSWERISPDLTYNDKNTMGDIRYHTIFTISESPLKYGLIYVGTDDGRAHVTKDGGKTWTEITNGLIPNRWMSRVVASAYDEGTVYLTQNGKRDDDFTPYIWKSTDYGKTWKSIVNNIPIGPVNVIREDPINKNILYVGNDMGVYVSIDGGAHWTVLNNNLPTTYVHDLAIHPKESFLIAATHGRAVWMMDIKNLQSLTPEILGKDAYLFEVGPASLPRFKDYEWSGERGTGFYYYLKNASDAKITIENEAGKLIKEIKGTGDSGMNLVLWDYTQEASQENSFQSPFVAPGKYKVILKTGNTTLEKILDLKGK